MTNEKKYQEPRFQTQKVYIDGDIHPIKVAMREITLADTKCQTHRKNPPITIYDTSGPFTDPNIEIDIRKGLHSRTMDFRSQ
jgi:phosphomethylpyrimidine synthase